MQTVRFDAADGNKPTQATVQTGTLVTPPQHSPQRQGFRFDGWTYDGQPFDLQTPILQDTTLRAKWSKTTGWTLSPDHGPVSGTRLTISPPNPQEPYYVSVQAAGDQFVGLTGDGRIYTWTQDSTPQQAPFPAQVPDGFRYLQVAAGNRWQAVLGSDQQIYIWASQQTTPTILDTDRNTEFTSIRMHGDRLLAVDRQGRVHAYQASQADSQNPELVQQAATSLPGEAQAATAVISASQALIVDTDGQAWTWDINNTRKAKPERIKQQPDMRIVQTQALNQGFLLLDADGQAWYLSDGTTGMTQDSLPDGVKTSRITASKDQAMITGTDGRVWEWKPGNKPIQADNGSRQYTQAASIGNRITAISKQGSMFTWSIAKQGQEARIDTTQAPILESASMDSQALMLTKNNDSWQVEIPAHKPGPVAITLAGRQDVKPFTRSLNYTVDQPLTRGTGPRSTLTVHFDTGGGNPEPADQHFPDPNSRVKRPSPDPGREGFLFDGWFINEVAYDFSKPVTGNLTLTAKWSPASRNSTWSINPDKGSQLGRESTTITPPGSANRGIRFSQVSGTKNPDLGFSLAVGSDGNAYAWGDNTYGQLGDGTKTSQITPVIVRKPEDAPADFTYVQVSAGCNHSLALGNDGYAYTWGWNYYGQLGNNTNYDSSVPVLVHDPNSPADANKGLKAVQVSGGWQHSLALGNDGYAYTWGWNYYGQLGNNTNYDSSVPVLVHDPNSPADANKGLKAVQVSGGWQHSLALGNDGYAYTWGYNYYGQLGNNTTSGHDANSIPARVRDPASPTDTSKGLKALEVSGGGEHSLALGSDGYAYTWGYNSNGQLGNNSTRNSTVPVHVRDPKSPTDTNKRLKVVQFSGGFDHSLAVGRDGNAYAWGYNYCGQLGNNSIPTGTSSNAMSRVPAPVSFNLQLVITGVRFGTSPGTNLKSSNDRSVTATTPAHVPGTVTVSVDYTLGGAPQTPDTSLRYTYLPAGVLPQAGGEGILLALATGTVSMGGVLASRRHRREQHQLSHASLE